jgi:hypothetical protein
MGPAFNPRAHQYQRRLGHLSIHTLLLGLLSLYYLFLVYSLFQFILILSAVHF